MHMGSHGFCPPLIPRLLTAMKLFYKCTVHAQVGPPEIRQSYYRSC